MTTQDVRLPLAAHPDATPMPTPHRGTERTIGLLFGITGAAVFAVMGIAGLLMRLGQAEIINVNPDWFFRLMTLHGGGMITGVLVMAMGGLWYVVRPVAPLRVGRMIATHILIVVGAVLVIVATIGGGFAAGWTFLAPLPFWSSGLWETWSVVLFLFGMLSIGVGFCVFCIDILQQTTTRYGGLGAALGWRHLRHPDTEPPPPQVISSTVIAICGLAASAAGMAIVVGLLTMAFDKNVAVEPLVAKNLTYFFGHTLANLGIYIGATALYVLMPRYAGRPYKTSKVFILGWGGSLVAILLAYVHHLYMDFAQPLWSGVIAQIASYGAVLPVAAITIYSMTMLVWGSRFQWTLASTLMYVGLTGWTIGGIGALIDSLMPVNFRLHNTAWVVAHFHTYELMTVVLWGLGFLAFLWERDAGSTVSFRARMWGLALIVIGGFGLTGTWFVAGAAGVPRRYAIQPDGSVGYSVVGALFTIVLAVGFLVLLVQLIALGRRGVARRHSPDALAGPPPVEIPPTAEVTADNRILCGPRARLIARIGFIVGMISFLPPIVEASKESARWHHLDHAGGFLAGAMVGLVIASMPQYLGRIRSMPTTALVVSIVAPLVMMLVMVPRIYLPMADDPMAHLVYHLGMAFCGLLTGAAVVGLGRVAGTVTLIMSVTMPVLFAAAMTTL